MLLAGSVAGVAATGVGLERNPAPGTPASSACITDAHTELLRLLSEVKRAAGPRARAHAFREFKASFLRHNVTEALSQAGGVKASSPGPARLYRKEDLSTLHAGVVIRELESMPGSDVNWTPRFSDLEAAILAHIAEHDLG